MPVLLPILAAFVPLFGVSEDVASANSTPALMASSNASFVSVRRSYEQRVLQLVNDARSTSGLRALRANTKLSAAGQMLADDLANTGAFAHQDSRGRNVSARLDAQGYDWGMAAENLAKGQKTPEQVVDQWLHSPKHRQNILTPGLTELGLGLARIDGDLIWVQVFGTSR